VHEIQNLLTLSVEIEIMFDYLKCLQEEGGKDEAGGDGRGSEGFPPAVDRLCWPLPFQGTNHEGSSRGGEQV
jgi:hypothetical protein